MVFLFGLMLDYGLVFIQIKRFCLTKKKKFVKSIISRKAILQTKIKAEVIEKLGKAVGPGALVLPIAFTAVQISPSSGKRHRLALSSGEMTDGMRPSKLQGNWG